MLSTVTGLVGQEPPLVWPVFSHGTAGIQPYLAPGDPPGLAVSSSPAGSSVFVLHPDSTGAWRLRIRHHGAKTKTEAPQIRVRRGLIGRRSREMSLQL